MEVSGMVFRQAPCFSSGVWSEFEDGGVSLRVGRRRRALGFRDMGHLQYYYGDGDRLIVRCGGKKEKKKLKLLKGLSKDLSLLSHYKDLDLMDDPIRPNIISEAAQVLMEQLQHLRADEKELKKNRKEEKAKMKAATMKTAMLVCESSTSESSDSECGEAIDVTHLRNEAVATAHPMISQFQQYPISLPQEEINASPQHHSLPSTTSTTTSCSNATSSSVSGSAKRIEVCMGNKCKKSGGATLLQEFEKAVMGVEGTVVGCKCMGKCRDGPNVRLFNSVDDPILDSVRTPANPLCIGVGLEDVSVIVDNFFGGDAKDFGLTPAS